MSTLFDIDDTLEVSRGPVKLLQLEALGAAGHIVGLCGNWAVVTMNVPDWHKLVSFLFPMGTDKWVALTFLRTHLGGGIERYVMVGNEVDRDQARVGGWEFVLEKDFKEGLAD